MPSLDTLTDRIRAEFGDLPGLKVTFAQACRLWHADEAKCLAALEALVDEGFLRRSASGAFIALPKPQRKAAKATLADSVPTMRCPHCHHRNVVNVERRLVAATRPVTFRCVACWRIVSVTSKVAKI
jgi:DNA-directed RNA polymerase subunit RPC12/RpoP